MEATRAKKREQHIKKGTCILVDDTIVVVLPNVPPLGNDSLTAPIDTATSPSKIIAPPTITAAQPTEMNSAPFTASTALPTTHHAHITDSQQIEVSIVPLNSHNPHETIAPPTRTTMQPCATDAEPSTASTLPTLANHTCKHNAAPTAASHNACECIAATTSTAMQPSVMDAMPFTAHTALPPVHIELHSENKDVAHTLAAPSPVHEYKKNKKNELLFIVLSQATILTVTKTHTRLISSSAISLRTVHLPY